MKEHAFPTSDVVETSLICFTGTTPNIGTTCISFGTALHTARLTKNKIGYLCLNLKSSKLHRYLGRDDSVVSLDRIRADLKSGTLDENRLLQHCDQLRGFDHFYFLYGNLLRDQAEYYQAEDIEHLLSVAASAFDICMIEVNAYWDNAATFCAMLRSGTKVLVTTPQLSHFQEDLSRWVKGFTSEIGMNTQQLNLFITQFSSQGSYSKTEIVKETDMPFIGQFPYFQELIPMLDQGKLQQFLLQNKTASASLTTLAQGWIDRFGLERKNNVNSSSQRTWMQKVLSSLHM